MDQQLHKHCSKKKTAQRTVFLLGQYNWSNYDKDLFDRTEKPDPKKKVVLKVNITANEKGSVKAIEGCNFIHSDSKLYIF